MTHSWHDSSIRVTWFIRMCGMTHLYVRHDSNSYVTGLIHMWHELCFTSMTCICATWFSCIRDRTHPFVTWIMSDIDDIHMSQDPPICDMSHVLHRWHAYVRHEFHSYVTGLIYMWHESCLTLMTFICHRTNPYVTWPMPHIDDMHMWHESCLTLLHESNLTLMTFICPTWNSSTSDSVTGLIHMPLCSFADTQGSFAEIEGFCADVQGSFADVQGSFCRALQRICRALLRTKLFACAKTKPSLLSCFFW